MFGPEVRPDSLRNRAEFLSWLRRAYPLPSFCIDWPWFRDDKGYGVIGYADASKSFAHRWVYEEMVGHIEDGQVVRHRCDRPPCVNPNHLQVGSRADNQRDMKIRGRAAHGERNARSKVTVEIAALILRLSAIEWSYRAIGDEVGISSMHVGRIIRGERWHDAIRTGMSG